MKTQEEKFDMLVRQVNAKIYWGARDQEVLDFLGEHDITGSDADALLVDAHRAKRKAVRAKALIMLIFSALGILFAGGFVAIQLWERLFVIGYGSVLVIGIGFASVASFFRSLVLLLTGETEGSVD